MLYLSGFALCLVFCETIVNYRRFTSFIAKIGYRSTGIDKILSGISLVCHIFGKAHQY